MLYVFATLHTAIGVLGILAATANDIHADPSPDDERPASDTNGLTVKLSF